jgi:hypothetical protein
MFLVNRSGCQAVIEGPFRGRMRQARVRPEYPYMVEVNAWPI